MFHKEAIRLQTWYKVNSHTARLSLVLLAVVGENQILQLDLDLDPLLVGQRRPDMVRLGDGRLVGLEHHLGAVVVDVHRAQDQDQSAERRVRRDRLQPVVVQVEQHHLRLRRLQYQVTKLLHLLVTTTSVLEQRHKVRDFIVPSPIPSTHLAFCCLVNRGKWV